MTNIKHAGKANNDRLIALTISDVIKLRRYDLMTSAELENICGIDERTIRRRYNDPWDNLKDYEEWMENEFYQRWQYIKDHQQRRTAGDFYFTLMTVLYNNRSFVDAMLDFRSEHFPIMRTLLEKAAYYLWADYLKEPSIRKVSKKAERILKNNFIEEYKSHCIIQLYVVIRDWQAKGLRDEGSVGFYAHKLEKAAKCFMFGESFTGEFVSILKDMTDLKYDFPCEYDEKWKMICEDSWIDDISSVMKYERRREYKKMLARERKLDQENGLNKEVK